MEPTIQSKQMDLENEKARPGTDLKDLPQERHIWRMPELPPIAQVSLQKVVQRSRGGKMGYMLKPFSGGHELLIKLKEISGSGEDNRDLGRFDSIFLQRQGQKYEELVEEPKSFIHRPKKEQEMTPALEKKGSVVSTSSRTFQRTSKQTERSQEKSRQRNRYNQLGKTLPKRIQDFHIGTFSHGKCVKNDQNHYEVHIQGA
ncbi:hypothetical protein O181_129795 [Austropuccinia psidii MF-1]|uniref:Uncharacterized protein n=1 Tax=Austropuccinia psidii MF-1 TaxID=1389203 RepID=A0A9Q3L2K8_9BASI|nr:hypothetical protein [Austropuccinia psidii MF-1]